MSDNDKKTVSPAGDGKYLLLVGGILLIIVLALAVLWQMERRRRAATQEQLSEYVTELNAANSEANKAHSMLSRLAETVMAATINRDELQPQQVELNGKPRKLFRISSSAGEKLGFQPGDLVEIDNPPAASAPNEQ